MDKPHLIWEYKNKPVITDTQIHILLNDLMLAGKFDHTTQNKSVLSIMCCQSETPTF